ncbi:hypothetical protein [Actinoplanes sp. NPDC089786]|uniref:hypothetical protein n=1 Tax=Actinoplanes sp. NPDC089786 TaxID=3155185 RepID=UPI003423A86A
MPVRKLFENFRSGGVPPVEQHERTFVSRLPSVIEGSHFDATFQVWFLTGGCRSEAEFHELRSYLIGQARVVTTRRTANDLDLVGPEVNNYLGRIDWTSSGRGALAVTVQLTASPEVRRIATEWEELRSRLAVERMRHALEDEELRHLRQDIFSQPAVARTYWLKHHPGALTDVAKDEPFESIAAKLGAASDRPSLAIARLIEDFLGKLDPKHAEYLVDQLANVFASYDRDDLSQRLVAAETHEGSDDPR